MTMNRVQFQARLPTAQLRDGYRCEEKCEAVLMIARRGPSAAAPCWTER
jgi:hypothetical protein